jgi:hypothetical protein
MAYLTEFLESRKRAPQLPNPDPLTMDYAARRIATRYNVSAGMARVVAELVGASIAECRR